ncbi:YheT family hydrolase [Granulicella mallensis]|uniref:Alpha/beta hydrolase fold protein n=1 Tax=Granulicella mallensis (strain ATCC BAA-1857 / DSM 23137 / MP5ACTX8) TaxID=682795 RepID=G8NPL8_GRAMM|nr:alpha/beta fold hydrolase [Granulicella mallensis]AEU36030.1 alpha/beta hydrolase fold protein [Granulicella mallensis MP5ACTX8]
MASPPWPEGYPEFQTRRWLSNGHLQTIFGNFLPRPNHLPRPVAQLVEVSPAHGTQISSQVLCECHWQPLPERPQRPTAIIVHGLEGSSRSQYVVGNANKLWQAGCNVIRMNMRNCGGTERLTPTLYHSGLSGDVGRVLRFFIETQGLQSVSLIGYSMGGNLVLKLAGELGADAPPALRSVIGVSPAVDLGVSADALHTWQNRLYERRFLNALLKRFRRKAMLFPRAFDPQRGTYITSVREFDDRITALYSGFRSADDYYHRAAAARVLDQIAVPALLLHACDDPFIRFTEETRAVIAANPHLTLLETEHGGHCAFLAPPDPMNGNDGYWAEHTAMRFVLAHA